MKIVSMACPHCGAALQLDADQKNLKCEYCGNSVFVDDEIKHIQIDNAEESGYLFEKGRQRAKAESAREYQHTIPTYTYEKPKKRRTWLWILGWLFIFPVPLTILMVRNQKINKKVKIVIIVIAWLVYLVMARSGKSGSSNRTKDTNESTISSNVEASVETDTKNDKENEGKKASDDKAEEDDRIIEPESIIIQADSTELVLGGTAKLTVEITPSDATVGEIQWSSSDENIIVVNEEGEATAVGGGTATITAVVSDSIQTTYDLSVDGTRRIMHVKVSKSNVGEDIGDEWTFEDKIDGEKVYYLKEISVGDTLSFYSKYTESDNNPDVGDASATHTVTEEDLQNGFTVSMDVYVTENGGKNKGEKAHYTVTYTFTVE